MEGERLHTISVSVCPDSYLIIPVRVDTGGEIGGSAPWTRQRGSLTPAQSDVLYRHVAAFRDVSEQIRALARGEFASADLGGDDAASPAPSDKNVRIARWRDVRCTGGRVYWW